MTLIEMLEKHNPCIEVYTWASQESGSLYNTWRACPRGDWLLWMAAKLGIERKLVVAAACDCAETSLKCVPEGEDRPANAIRVARAWIAGDASIAEVSEARRAAAAAGGGVAAVAAAYAAAMAAAAAYAVAADSVAAVAASYAAAARGSQHKEMATLVRKAIPWAAWKSAIAKGEDQ